MMRDDELQVLGRQRKKEWSRWWMATAIGIAVFAMITVICLYFMHSHKENHIDKGTSTLIPEWQEAVDSMLNEQLTNISGLQGQVIVMEVQTGKIRAMAGRERDFEGKYQPCKNFGYKQLPGSTMKTAALLALLETGEVKLSDEVDTGNGFWIVDEENVIKDHNWHRGGYGMLTLERALEVSSNIGIGKTVRKVFNGKELRFYELLDSIGVGQPDSIEGIVGLKPMAFSSPKDSTWASRQLLWNAIGHERTMAPIQTLTFYNAIANNGKMVKPLLREGNPEVIKERIASSQSIQEIQKALYHVVSEGLGKKAGSPKVKVAGKTGTAILQAPFGLSDDGIDEYHVSFCGYFPAFAPKYSIIVSLNKIGLPASGGGMAGDLFRQVAEYISNSSLDIKQ